MKNLNINNKYFLLFIGFTISWIIAVLLFYPQPVQYGWFATAISVIIFGYSWIIPITFLLLYFSKDNNKFRKTISNKYFTFSLYFILILVLLISWNLKFSNDMIFIGYWALVTLTWINIYLILKRKKFEHNEKHSADSTTHNNV